MEDNLTTALYKLIELGVSPDLHHTPLRAGYTEDPGDPEPRWCCHDQNDTNWHNHGNTAFEAVNGLVEMIKTRKR